jgi:hypothetical protein
MGQGLEPLEDADRQLAPTLHRPQVPGFRFALPQWPGQRVRRDDGVLYREVDSHPAYRRHRVGGVADAQEARLVPTPQAVHLN